MLMDLDNLPKVGGAVRDSSAYRAAGRNGLPVLAICGTEDQLCDAPAALEKFREDFVDLEIINLEGAGHAITDERPQEINQSILRFAQKHIHK